MYLARGKNGKLGRQTKGRQARRADGSMGYVVETESPRGERFRDVNVTNESVARDQYDDQLGAARLVAAEAAAASRRRGVARAAARRYSEGKQCAVQSQGTKKPDSTQQTLKDYFGRRAQMTGTGRTMGDLSRSQGARSKVDDWSARDLIPAPQGQTSRMDRGNLQENYYADVWARSAPGLERTRTADFRILNEVPDTEFQNVISHGADFESQFPVGNPISPNGTGYLHTGPATDFDRFVYDDEQNVTRAQGGFDLSKSGGNIVGGTMLGRSNGKSRPYHGYGSYGKYRKRLGSHPVQASFGQDEEYDYTIFDAPPEDTTGFEIFTDPNVGDEPVATGPSWWERVGEGLTSGLTQGAETGVRDATGRLISQTLAPQAAKPPSTIVQYVTGGKSKQQLLAEATNPISRAGASMGLTPGLTYGLFGLIGLSAAALVYKAVKK